MNGVFNMEWKIRKCGHGGFTADYGISHAGGVQIGFAGVTMPGFRVYFSMHFDTERQAKAYIKKNPNPMK